MQLIAAQRERSQGQHTVATHVQHAHAAQVQPYENCCTCGECISAPPSPNSACAMAGGRPPGIIVVLPEAVAVGSRAPLALLPAARRVRGGELLWVREDRMGMPGGTADALPRCVSDQRALLEPPAAA